MFWGKATSYYVVAVDHALAKFAVNIGVRHISRYPKPLTFLKFKDVHSQNKQNADVGITILLY